MKVSSIELVGSKRLKTANVENFANNKLDDYSRLPSVVSRLSPRFISP